VLYQDWQARFEEQQPQVWAALKKFVTFYVRNDDNCGWHAGEWPRTNNALESANRQFKDRFTMRRRVPIREFLELAMDYVRVRSLAREQQVGSSIFTIDF
jgi:hypothetical protein